MKTARVTIRLLREFTVEAPELGVTELSRRLNLNKATIHRLLKSLCEEGIIEQDLTTKKYGLGLAILDLAAARLHAFGFVEQAAEEMRTLREVVGESIALHVRDGEDMVCVHFNEASHPLTVRFTLGERVPIHLIAGGLIHLANLHEDERRLLISRSIAAHPGYPNCSPRKILEAVEKAKREAVALTDETLQKGVRGLATAVRDGHDDLLGSLSVVAPTSRLSLPEFKKLKLQLVASARRIGSRVRRI